MDVCLPTTVPRWIQIESINDKVSMEVDGIPF